MSTSVKRPWLLVLVAVALLVAACGDDDDDGGDTTTTVADGADATTTAPPETTAPPATEAPAEDGGEDGGDEGAAGTVEVTGVDYAYVGLPPTVPVGTEIVFSNDSEVEVHEFVAVLLPEDEERSVEELLQLPEEELAVLFPGVQTVLVAPPASAGFAVEGDGVLTEPGRYAIACFIPTGADPDEFLAAAAESDGPPDVDGGPPHFVEGMWAELVVE